MPELKLAKLPDRVPVKLTVTVTPELSRRLVNYAALYKRTYGQEESVSELVPFMLGQFLDADRAFAKSNKDAPTSERPGHQV